MLPLDLHVLSLSLAFILSQDQTLHCWNKFVCCSFSSKIRSIVFDLFLSKHWRGNVGYLSYPIFPCTTCQSLIVLRSICLWSRCCPLLLQSDCKGTKIFYSRNRWAKKKNTQNELFIHHQTSTHTQYIEVKVLITRESAFRIGPEYFLIRDRILSVRLQKVFCRMTD